jgi:hypothetical protein
MADDAAEWVLPALRTALTHAERIIDRDRDDLLAAHGSVRAELIALERRLELVCPDDVRWTLNRGVDALLETLGDAEARMDRVYGVAALERIKTVITDLRMELPPGRRGQA